MKWKEYNYTGQWGGGGIIYRPLLPVTFRNGDNEFSPLCLIDSGTDSTLITYEVASVLGINLNLCEGVKIGGVGKSHGKICDVFLELPDFKIRKKISAIFTPELPFSVLLGQKDFFNELDVEFEKSKNLFFLRTPKQ